MKKKERNAMAKQSRINIIVCIVSVCTLLGLTSFSAPKAVRADEVLPGSEGIEAWKMESGNVQWDGRTQVMSYGGGGFNSFNAAVYPIGDNCIMNGEAETKPAFHNVNLPNGSVISSIDFSGHDYSDISEMKLEFIESKFDGVIGRTWAVLNSNIDFDGGVYVRSMPFDPPIVVDNLVYNYVLKLTMPRLTEQNVLFCQATISYNPPSIFAQALPLIRK